MTKENDRLERQRSIRKVIQGKIEARKADNVQHFLHQKEHPFEKLPRYARLSCCSKQRSDENECGGLVKKKRQKNTEVLFPRHVAPHIPFELT